MSDVNTPSDSNGVDPVNTDTQQPTNQTDPTNESGGHSEGSNNEDSSSAPQAGGQPDVNNGDHTVSRLEGKLKQTQEQLKAAEEKARYYDNIQQKAMRSPEAYKKALQEYNDYSEEQAQAEIERMVQAGMWQQNQQPQQQGVQGQPVAGGTLDQSALERAAQQALAKAEFAKQQDNAAAKLKEKYPQLMDMDPEQRKAVLTNAEQYAMLDIQTKGQSYEEAILNNVARQLNVNSEYEKGRVEGMAQANGYNNTVLPSPQGQQTDPSANIPEDWKAHAAALGIPVERYAYHRRKGN